MPSPDSRRVLGDVANAPRAPSSPVLALAAKLSTPSPVVSSETFDGWRVNANPSFSPSAEVTERASMPPKSPAEELAHRAALAAAKIRRGGSTSPPDYASHATPSPTERPRRSGSGSGSASGSERSKISSAERAKRMASHAERAYDDPGIVDGEHSPPSSDADDALRALEAELSVGGVGSNFTLDADRVDAATPNAKRPSKNATPTTSKESKESKESKTGSADSFTFDAAATRPEPSSSASASGGSPFVRLVAVDAVDGEEDDAPESGESGETGGGEKNPTGGSSGAGSAPGGSAGNARGGDERTGRGSSRGGDESNGGGGDVSGFGRGGFGGGGGGDASPPFPGTSRERLVSSTLPADAGVTLASALGRWREAVAVAAVVSDAANTRDELTEILREQAETCDEEVNHLTDEVDALTAALSESASENLRLRWRWAAKASLASVKAEEYRGEARRLRAKALKLESQLLKVEAHITSAAADFDRLRGRLTESTRETERARASEAKAREQLAAAQSAAAAAQSAAAEAAARADAYDKTAAELSRRSPLKENHGATPGGDEEAMRAAIRAELRDDARARIRAELRAEMRAELRAELGEELRAEAEAEAAAEAAEVAKRKIEAGAASGTVAACIDGLLRSARSVQMRQVAAARREATERARVNLEAAAQAGAETLRLGAPAEEGGVDPLELVSLIAVHALERCEAHPHGDGARAFYRAARRVELAARACQPEYRAGGSGMKLKSTATFASPTPGRSQRAPRT